MKEENIYQKWLINSIENTINGIVSCKEYLERLASMKADKVFCDCIGRKFRSDDLKQVVIAVAVGYEIKSRIWESDKYDDDAIVIKIGFVADVDSILSSKKSITETEKKYLKKISGMIKEAKMLSSDKYPWRKKADNKTLSELRDINYSLDETKNKLKVIDIPMWCFDLNAVVADNFIEKGLSYDSQSI